MTNPSDDQPDPNQPADGSTPPPPASPDAAPEQAQQPGQPDPTQPAYGQTYGEQPANPYGGATFDQKPPAASYGTPPPPPPAYGAQPGYGAQPYGGQAPYGAGVGQPDSGSTTAMVLGIIGVAGGLACYLPLLASPFALFLGLASKKRIDASNGGLTGRGQAQAGFILGIIGTVILVLGILLIVGLVIIGISGGFDDPSSSYEPYDSGI
ncbi:DUF4190 domain-containing protein [Nocardioides albertanoniae]|nr:DUF4190 domain-containing protein [Nocardioides albertanoniae]